MLLSSFSRTLCAAVCRRQIILTALALSCGLLAGPLRAQFVYVVNTGANDISGYTLDPANGDLTSMPAPFPTGNFPFGIAIDPASRFAYVVNVNDSTVSGYSIDKKTGALTAVPESPFSTGPQSSPFAVAVDPLSRFVWGIHPRSMAVAPNSKFAYVVSYFDSDVLGYSVDPKTGALTQVPGSPPTGIEPHWVAVDPTGQFVYVPNYSDNNVSAYTIDCAGSLTPVSGSPFVAGNGPSAMVITK